MERYMATIKREIMRIEMYLQKDVGWICSAYTTSDGPPVFEVGGDSPEKALSALKALYSIKKIPEVDYA